mgnify:CR=1 FL=1
MFEITEDTKIAAGKAVNEVLTGNGYQEVSQDIMDQAIDAAVAVVKAQFGF